MTWRIEYDLNYPIIKELKDSSNPIIRWLEKLELRPRETIISDKGRINFDNKIIIYHPAQQQMIDEEEILHNMNINFP